MTKPKIVVVGSSNTDMVIRARSLPRPGETLLGGEFLLAAGGKGANQAVAAARSGGDVTLVACVGDDDLGRSALAGFRRDRIRVEHVRVAKNVASGVALIMVDAKGENLISVAPGANALLSPADVERAEAAIAGADCLLAQLEVPLDAVKRALQIAKQHGVMTILNPAPARLLPRSLLKLVDVLTPNRTELRKTGTVLKLGTVPLSGTVPNFRTIGAREKGTVPNSGTVPFFRALRHAGVGAIVVTLGDKGAVIHDGKETRIPAFKVHAVDAVAAGDVFSGALAVALTEGRALSDAVRFASAAAAISVTRKGAQPSIPRRGEIDRFLKAHRTL